MIRRKRGLSRTRLAIVRMYSKWTERQQEGTGRSDREAGALYRPQYRSYAGRSLRRAARKGKPRAPVRRPTCSPESLQSLRRMWVTLDGVSGKRLAPFLLEIATVIERASEPHLSPPVREKLLVISAATIDRLLAPKRRRLHYPRPLTDQTGHAPPSDPGGQRPAGDPGCAR